MTVKIILLIPKILGSIIIEHRALKKIVRENKIDIVISDNRYGLWNKEIKSIFITHQLFIKAPFLENVVHLMVAFFVNKYDECWIPDVMGNDNLSGDLSHKNTLPKNSSFVGLLSRFNSDEKIMLPFKYDVMAIISGPEPQRGILEKLIIEQIKTSSLKALVVCGTPLFRDKVNYNNKLKIVAHLNSNEMQQAILQSKMIISRSGYSTIMDLAVLGKQAVFIPTPGQTEQEYLAELLMQKGVAFFQSQDNFNLQQALMESANYKGFLRINTSNQLEKGVERLLM